MTNMSFSRDHVLDKSSTASKAILVVDFYHPDTFACVGVGIELCLVVQLSKRIKPELATLLDVPISELEIWKVVGILFSSVP